VSVILDFLEAVALGKTHCFEQVFGLCLCRHPSGYSKLGVKDKQETQDMRVLVVEFISQLEHPEKF